MSSILKVDQIQTTAGATPTVTDLGFNLFIDGVSTGLGDENNSVWYHEGYGFAAGSREAPKGYFGTNTLSAGAHEVKFTFAMYGGANGTVKYQNTSVRYLIHEIKV